MTLFTDRPQRILGNIAVTSLVAGIPVGLLVTILTSAFIQPKHHSVLEWIKEIGAGLLFGPFFVFLAGVILILPILTALRRFGYGGPFFVYAISVAIGLLALHDDPRFGLIVIVFALSSSYVFCRYAYSDVEN